MQKTRTVTVTTSVVACDICGDESSTQYRCPGCGKDICKKCGCWWTRDPWTGQDNGDYPPLVCKECHMIANSMCNETISIQNEAEERIEAIVNKWKSACMGRK